MDKLSTSHKCLDYALTDFKGSLLLTAQVTTCYYLTSKRNKCLNFILKFIKRSEIKET